MSAGFNQWCRVTREATYGVYNPGTLVEGTDFVWARLVGDDPMPMRREPAFYTIRSADSFNRRVQTGTGRYDLKGTLATEFYPTQAAFWMGLGLTLNGSNDLASFTLEYFDTVRTHRYLGCKIAKVALTSTAQQQDIKFTMDLVGQQSVATPPSLAMPTQANFPSNPSLPYTFQDSAGQVKLNNVVRVAYSDLSFTVTNMLTPTVNELAYISNLYWCGRDVDLSIKGEYLAATDRDALTAGTIQSSSQVRWIKGPTGSPTNSFTLTFPTSYIKKVADSLPLAGAAYQSLDVEVYMDQTTNNDFTFAVTP